MGTSAFVKCMVSSNELGPWVEIAKAESQSAVNAGKTERVNDVGDTTLDALRRYERTYPRRNCKTTLEMLGLTAGLRPVP
jgi:hypothetical protein